MKIVILLLLTSFFWGLAPIFDKLAIDRANPFVGTTVRTVIVALMLLMAVVITGKSKEMFEMDGRALFYFTLSGLVAGCIGVYTYYAALKMGETSRIVPLAATYPLVTAVLSVIFLKESVSLERIIGIILIVTGIWFVK